ncbi:MAG: hypothetical protein PVH61_14410 [Candidatus Aminicenantes bacterium]
MMKQTSKTTILKVLLGIFILGLFQMQGITRIIFNKSEIGFEEPDSTGIRTYVIEAAGFFLKSQADFSLFLNKIEMEEINGVDFAELQQVISNAVVYMEQARKKYNDLTQLADSTPYDQSTINTLVNFNYASFQGSKELNSVIFNEVETYFNSGDVRGLYHRLLVETQTILDQLILIKYDVDAEVLPGNSDLWGVNQSYCKNLLFGQYAAKIFYDVAGK